MKKIKSVSVDYIEITGSIQAQTPKAILLNDGDKEGWIPRSQIEDIEINGDTAVVLMPEWLAKAKGFI